MKFKFRNNGANWRITVKGGFFSGYQGEGPQALKKTITELGFNEAIIEVNVNRVGKKSTLIK